MDEVLEFITRSESHVALLLSFLALVLTLPANAIIWLLLVVLFSVLITAPPEYVKGILGQNGPFVNLLLVFYVLLKTIPPNWILMLLLAVLFFPSKFKPLSERIKSMMYSDAAISRKIVVIEGNGEAISMSEMADVMANSTTDPQEVIIRRLLARGCTIKGSLSSVEQKKEFSDENGTLTMTRDELSYGGGLGNGI